jgi:hypothetical protein
MHRLVLFIGLIGTTSCASSGSSTKTGLESPTERVIAADNQGAYRTTVAPNAKMSVAAPPSRVFEALGAVYSALDIPIATNDPASGRVGNTDFWKSRKLGGQAISTYLNCGESITGAAADNYRVYISLLSEVRPDGSGSVLETAFTATARNMEGTTADRVACGTTGRLEERIYKDVMAKLATTKPG